MEELGGIRQASRVIPILTELAETEQNYKDILEGEKDINDDIEKQRKTLAFRLDQLRQNFSRLIGEIFDSEGFQTLIDFFINATNAAINFTRALKDLIPVLLAIFSLRLGRSIGRLASGGLGSAVAFGS